ncbi:long-chain fatty acid--CoA ligase [bacterium]|nr:long-chain fatty acid--CoA ligase [bacterium]
MPQTLSQLFLNTVDSYPKEDLMLHKVEGDYVPVSTERFAHQVKHLTLGLKNLGLNPGDKIIILSENRPEWVMADLAVLCLGGMTVPVYTSLVPEQIRFIIDHSDAKAVFCSGSTLWSKVEGIRNQLKKVKHYITFESDVSSKALTMDQVVDQGMDLAHKKPDLFEKMALEVKPDQVASIIYTSGTTGEPKGVMLTHHNFLSNVKSLCTIIPFSHEDTVLSFLPLSHVLERLATFAYIYKGCSIGYAESVETVAENLMELKPHIMVSVPRVFEKIYAKVMENVLAGSSVEKKIFFWAEKVGKDYGEKKVENQKISGFLNLKRRVAHKLVFSKIVQKTGGRVRFFVSGGAPLSKDIAEFFYAMGLIILEGYGLTETSPVIAANTLENIRFGSVGKPIPGVEVKIAGDGEILTRGPNVMKGYYKKEEETREVFEGEWLHTGDIGNLDDDGFLHITDRKKDLIVTAGGKNVAPQIIENLLKTNRYITNVVVIGEKRRFISALVAPNFEKIEQYARDHSIPFQKRRDLVQNQQIVDLVKNEIDKATSSLSSYEKIKKIALLERDFEIGKGEITPTLKVRRNIIESKYKDLIDSLYED